MFQNKILFKYFINISYISKTVTIITIYFMIKSSFKTIYFTVIAQN